jgi:hypothetical protein
MAYSAGKISAIIKFPCRKFLAETVDGYFLARRSRVGECVIFSAVAALGWRNRAR